MSGVYATSEGDDLEESAGEMFITTDEGEDRQKGELSGMATRSEGDLEESATRALMRLPSNRYNSQIVQSVSPRERRS